MAAELVNGELVERQKVALELGTTGPRVQDLPPLGSVIQYMELATPKATRKAYAGDWARFQAWCRDQRGYGKAWAEMPAPVPVVLAYLAACADGGSKPASLDRYVVSIAHHHQAAGHAPPTSHAYVRRLMRGIRRKLTTAQREAAPILPELLRHFVRYAGIGNHAQRDRAMALVCFAAGLRESELVALTVEDFAVDDLGAVVHIRKSKTDQEGRGRRVRVPFGTDLMVCPVRHVRLWLEASGVTSGPLFREVRGDKVQPGAASVSVVHRLAKRIAKEAGLDGKRYSGHSFRAGLVTAAAIAGKPAHVIQATTGHTDPRMLKRYMRDLHLRGASAADGLL